MWSGEEGSCSSSGHQFPLRGLPPPMETPHELAAPGVPRTLQLRQHSRCESTQPLLHPKCTRGYKTNGPDTRDPLCELRDADTCESCSFPLSGLFLSYPKTTVPLPSPCIPVPPDPRHESCFLILSRGPHFPAMSCYVRVQTLAFLVRSEFMLLSS